MSERPAPPPRQSRLSTLWTTLHANWTVLFASIVCGFFAIAMCWIPPRGDWTYRWARIWSRWVLWASRTTVTRSFEVPLDSGRGYVFLANHQSMYDVPGLIVGYPGQARFLAKRSLFHIPFFGWALAAGGFVPVDRKDRNASRETFRVAVERLRAGKSIMLFPEETRSQDGELLPFKRGGVLLALKTGYPIVPVGLRGTREVRAPHRWTVRPGAIEVRFGTPIEVEGAALGESKELMARVRGEIQRLAHGDLGDQVDHGDDAAASAPSSH